MACGLSLLPFPSRGYDSHSPSPRPRHAVRGGIAGHCWSCEHYQSIRFGKTTPRRPIGRQRFHQASKVQMYFFGERDNGMAVFSLTRGITHVTGFTCQFQSNYLQLPELDAQYRKPRARPSDFIPQKFVVVTLTLTQRRCFVRTYEMEKDDKR